MAKAVHKFVKRTADVVLAVLGLVVLSPVLAAIAILIKVGSRGPVLYRGTRTGLHGRPFRIMKFRTMVVDAESLGGGTTALGDPRITRIGHRLRGLKLDELPQLWNVLVGEMSFVGPRPELARYTDQYDERLRVILDVKPGITDLSSIHFSSLDEIVGSDDADEAYERHVLAKKNELRLYYAQHSSLALDCQILFQTFAVLLKKAVRRAAPVEGRGAHGAP